MSLMLNPAEFHETIDFGSIVNGALKEVTLVKKFPLPKYLWGVQIEYLARAAVTVAAPGAVLPESTKTGRGRSSTSPEPHSTSISLPAT